MRNLVAEFRQFILRGNVVDLAVGIVIGVVFTGVVQGLGQGFINPLIAAPFGKPDFSTCGLATACWQDGVMATR